jgi:hypothetical protein
MATIIVAMTVICPLQAHIIQTKHAGLDTLMNMTIDDE